MERLRVCYGRVPRLMGSWTGQKYEKEAGINTPSYFSHRQVFCSPQPPECLGSLHHCKTPGLQQCQITSVAVALSIPLHFHPVVLMSITTTSSLLLQLAFLSHQIFSPVHSAATATFLHTRQTDAEVAGNSWECPCIPFQPYLFTLQHLQCLATSSYAAA